MDTTLGQSCTHTHRYSCTLTCAHSRTFTHMDIHIMNTCAFMDTPTHSRTLTHVDTYTYPRTFVHSFASTCAYSQTLIHTQGHSCTLVLTRPRVRIFIYTHAHGHSYTWMLTHTCGYSYTHTDMHTHHHMLTDTLTVGRHSREAGTAQALGLGPRPPIPLSPCASIQGLLTRPLQLTLAVPGGCSALPWTLRAPPPRQCPEDHLPAPDPCPRPLGSQVFPAPTPPAGSAW